MAPASFKLPFYGTRTSWARTPHAVPLCVHNEGRKFCRIKKTACFEGVSWRKTDSNQWSPGSRTYSKAGRAQTWSFSMIIREVWEILLRITLCRDQRDIKKASHLNFPWKFSMKIKSANDRTRHPVMQLWSCKARKSSTRCCVFCFWRKHDHLFTCYVIMELSEQKLLPERKKNFCVCPLT